MSNQHPPEILECIAAHLLALEWLVEEVQAIDGLAVLFIAPARLVFEAQLQGVRRYRAMTPDQLRETCDRALENYRAIAAGDFEAPTTEDTNK